MKTSFKRKFVFATGALLAFVIVDACHETPLTDTVVNHVKHHVQAHTNPNMHMAIPSGTHLVLMQKNGNTRHIATQGTTQCPDLPEQQCWVWKMSDTSLDVEYVDIHTRKWQKETWLLHSENGKTYIRTTRDEFVIQA